MDICICCVNSHLVGCIQKRTVFIVQVGFWLRPSSLYIASLHNVVCTCWRFNLFWNSIDVLYIKHPIKNAPCLTLLLLLFSLLCIFEKVKMKALSFCLCFAFVRCRFKSLPTLYAKFVNKNDNDEVSLCEYFLSDILGDSTFV